MFLTRYNNTFSLMNDMARELDRVLSDRSFSLPTTSARSPRGALEETDTAFVLRMEVPGLAPEALTLRVEDNALHLAGERNDEVPEGYTARRTERVRFRFDRSLPLPEQVDAERIEAVLKDGLLTITLPKTEKAAPRKIDVRAG